MKSWKQNNLLNSLRENVDTSLILSNPKEYFTQTDWTIPDNNYDEVVNYLFELMSKDSDPENKEIGKNGRNAYKICDYLASNGKNPQFSKDWNQAKNIANSQINENLIRESIKSKLAMIALIGTIGLSTLNASPNNMKASIDALNNLKSTTTSIDNYVAGTKSYLDDMISSGNLTPEEADKVLDSIGLTTFKSKNYYANKYNSVNNVSNIKKQSQEAYDTVKNTMSKYHSRDTKKSYIDLQLHNGNINQTQYNQLIELV